MEPITHIDLYRLLTNVLTSIEIHTMNMNSVTISGDKIQNFITKY